VEARELAMLRDTDSFLMNRDRLLSAALNAINDMPAPMYYQRPALQMPGRDVYQAMGEWLDKAHTKGQLTPHDTVVGRGIAAIVSGGDIDAGTLWTEQDLYDAERRVFLQLAQTEATQARINSMLDLGRNLRN
jgi:3-hydroxyacyl-CoA dehydrogenase